MKNYITRAIIFIVIGVACFVASIATKGAAEKWSSFFFGLSLPVMVRGLVYIIQHVRKQRQKVFFIS